MQKDKRKISVITPTEERARFLKGCHTLLQNQLYQNWEWLIYDTSLKASQFSDPRITYIHDSQELITIGEKRNRLIEKATGDLIVHFDDDDYYGPSYLAMVADRLEKSSFYTAHAWFSYDLKTDQIFYWDTEILSGVSYSVSPLSGATVREIDFGPSSAKQREALNYKGKRGYGFSYAYSNEVARSCLFQDVDLSEDRLFYEDVEKKGFLITTAPDEKGEAIHLIHDSNTSAEFPQFRIPKFLVQNLFPPFFEHIKQTHED